MNFIKEKIKDFYLLDSKVENIFINEYMPIAPGEYVKVFLFAEMYAEFNLDIDSSLMAKQLGISEKKLGEAWDYWENMGAIKKHYLDEEGKLNYTVEFVNLKELMYGKASSPVKGDVEPKKPNPFGNPALKTALESIEVTMGRPLSSTEINNILTLVSDYNVTPEVLKMGVEYCVGKNKTSMRYIESVVKNWAGEGITTVDGINDYLQETDERFYRYKRVLKSLGFTRNATEIEQKMMDTWFDKMGYNMDRVLEACSKTAGIPSPNFNYVNKVLENWEKTAERTGNNVNKKQTVTQSILNQYYDFLRDKAEKDAELHKAEIYDKIPKVKEIDDEIKDISISLSKALVAGNAEKEGKKLREQMDVLAGERAVLLTENNYEMDYTDIRYTCEKCSDTGVTDIGERCSCIKERMEEAELWQKKREK